RRSSDLIAEVLDDLHTVRFERIVEFFNVLGVEVELAERVENLLCRELSLALAELDQLADDGLFILCCHSASNLSCIFPYSFKISRSVYFFCLRSASNCA